ncbi:MAG TPA: cupin domain-containing protein [Gaiellaceae bacterium]|nr:cupin domain-containing protein [Gaiellaceae bacterium]
MNEEQYEFQSLEELADAIEGQGQGPPAVEVWQDYDPSQRFVAVFPVTEAQGAASSTVAYYIFEPGRHSGLHADSAEEVLYVADGVGEVFVSGRQVKLEPGEFVVINQGVQHDVYAYGDRELRLLSFFPAAVVESTFQDPILPMGTNVLSSSLGAPVIREITADELPPELRHLAGDEPPPAGAQPEG